MDGAAFSRAEAVLSVPHDGEYRFVLTSLADDLDAVLRVTAPGVNLEAPEERCEGFGAALRLGCRIAGVRVHVGPDPSSCPSVWCWRCVRPLGSCGRRCALKALAHVGVAPVTTPQDEPSPS